MLDSESRTYEVLKDIGVDMVKFARIKIGDRNRKRRSKITGKLRKGKIDSSGKMRKSLKHDISEESDGLKLDFIGVDYTQDVNDGTKRKTSVKDIERWMKTKRIRLTNSKGFIKMTPARIASFANFVAWKVSTIGSDETNFLDEAREEAIKKHEDDLLEAIIEDGATDLEFILSGLSALKIEFKFD